MNEHKQTILSIRHIPSNLWISYRKNHYYLTGHAHQAYFFVSVPSINELDSIASEIGVLKEDLKIVGWSTTDDVFVARY